MSSDLGVRRKKTSSVLLQQRPAIGIRFELAEERQGQPWELTVVKDEVSESQCVALFSAHKFCTISPIFPKAVSDISCQ